MFLTLCITPAYPFLLAISLRPCSVLPLKIQIYGITILSTPANMIETMETLPIIHLSSLRSLSLCSPSHYFHLLHPPTPCSFPLSSLSISSIFYISIILSTFPYWPSQGPLLNLPSSLTNFSVLSTLSPSCSFPPINLLTFSCTSRSSTEQFLTCWFNFSVSDSIHHCGYLEHQTSHPSPSTYKEPTLPPTMKFSYSNHLLSLQTRLSFQMSEALCCFYL